MASKKVEEKRMYAQISELRKKLALTDSQEESQMYVDQIAELKDKLMRINRKDPVVVPVKNAATIGDRIERRLNNGKPMTSSYTRTRVKL